MITSPSLFLSSLSLSLERNLALEFFHRCSDVCVYVYIYGDTRATFRNV